MNEKKIYKTLALSLVPLPNTFIADLTMDIGKYFDNNAVRIVKIWAHCLYTDVTAGSPQEAADCFLTIAGVTTMQGVTVTPSSGLGTNDAFFVVPGGNETSEFDVLGDAVLETPTFTIQAQGLKKPGGGFPAAFNFIFQIVVQLEFNFQDLNEQL